MPQEKILEHYWGEHIHLGYYTLEEQKQGYLKKNFIGAKYDFIDQMMAFAKLDGVNFKPAKVLDVGCGIGGTTRYIAKVCMCACMYVHEGRSTCVLYIKVSLPCRSVDIKETVCRVCCGFPSF